MNMHVFSFTRVLVRVLQAGLLILLIDAIGWFAWAMSGQYPIDEFYVGTITMHIIRLFI